MAAAAARSDIHRREPAGCCRQRRYRDGGALSGGRLHASGHFVEQRDQHHALWAVDFAREIAPIATFGRGYQVLNVNNSLPVKTVPDLIALAKADPGKLSMASPGIGSAGHVAGEMFKMMTGVNMLHVPYRGSVPALTDLMSAQVQVMFDNLPSSIEHIRAGSSCALAVTPATRSPVLPDIPTIGESVPGYVGGGWSGLGAPASTPSEIVDLLNREVNAALADPKIKGR